MIHSLNLKLKLLSLLTIASFGMGNKVKAEFKCDAIFSTAELNQLSPQEQLIRILKDAKQSKDYVEIETRQSMRTGQKLTGNVQNLRLVGPHWVVDFINIEEQNGSFEINVSSINSAKIINSTSISHEIKKMAETSVPMKTILTAIKSGEYLVFKSTNSFYVDAGEPIVEKPAFVRNGRLGLEIGFHATLQHDNTLRRIQHIDLTSLKILSQQTMLIEVSKTIAGLNKSVQQSYINLLNSLVHKTKISVESSGIIGATKGIVELAYVDDGEVRFILKIENSPDDIRYQEFKSRYGLDISLVP